MTGRVAPPGEPKLQLLDWCGNTGGNAMLLANLEPTLNVTMLDLPAQCAKADVSINAAGLSERVSTLPADLLNESTRLPAKYDVVTMIHTIREWSADHLQHFFNMIHEALNPGGAVVMNMVDEFGVGKSFEQRGSYKAGRTMLYFLVSASTEQHSHTADDLQSMLRTAGFANTTYTEEGLVLALKSN